MNITEIVKTQREYFMSGVTRSADFRIKALIRLRHVIMKNENLLSEALLSDLNKPISESYMCEIGIIYEEINYHIKHLRSWMKDRRVAAPLAQFLSKSYLSPEPYGVVLIMAPWNYPMQLCFSPLIGAISAGNCAVVKPSAYAPATSSAVAKIINEAFSSKYVAAVEGGRDKNSALLEQHFDYIFFTGSVAVGKAVMAAAAKHLTPVSLELGGKSPVIVDETANIKISARRIAFGKILNAGQTCISPDYVFVHKSIKDDFIRYYKKAISEFFPKGDYSDMPHIVNEKHFNRLMGLMKGEKVAAGGNCNAETRFIEPTLLEDTKLNAPIMQEEIFGPILPMIEFTDINGCIKFIRSRPKPLALYLFTNRKQTEQLILNTCSFGGGCINDTVIHVATQNMGFGGIGESGMGSYHGKFTFDTFSHNRGIVNKRYFPDIPMRYRPYNHVKDIMVRMLLR